MADDFILFVRLQVRYGTGPDRTGPHHVCVYIVLGKEVCTMYLLYALYGAVCPVRCVCEVCVWTREHHVWAERSVVTQHPHAEIDFPARRRWLSIPDSRYGGSEGEEGCMYAYGRAL